jgi:hypothetical protein
VRIESFPKAVDVFLDGKAVAFDDTHPTLDVPATGKHRLRFENPACFPEEKDVTGDEIKVHLRWRPARIHIEAPPEAIVLWRGRPVQSGLIEAEVAGEARDITVEVQASAPGSPSRTVRCRGVAGEERSCKIALGEGE